MIERPVHPNSTAARKWKRTTWRTSVHLYARASEAQRDGDLARASAVRRKAARRDVTTYHCG